MATRTSKYDKKKSKYIKQLYDETEEQLEEVYKVHKDNKKKLEEKVGLILLTYTIVKNLVTMSSKDQAKEHKEFDKLLKSMYLAVGTASIIATDKILEDQTKKMYEFLGVTRSKQDIRKFVKKAFNNETYSKRIWKNEDKVKAALKIEFTKFLKGETNVNNIKDKFNKILVREMGTIKYDNIKNKFAKVFKAQRYNIDRLVDTELTRVINMALLDSYEEQGVTHVRWCSVLEEGTCADCRDLDGTVFKIEDAHGLIPAHPNCKCYWERV